MRFLILCLVLSLSSCLETPYRQGKIMYENFCANCHMENGEGLKGLIPPLAQADFVRDNQSDLACIIRQGISDTIVVNQKIYVQPMAGIPQLSAAEITNIINFINQAWGNDYGYISTQVVIEELKQCKDAF